LSYPTPEVFIVDIQNFLKLQPGFENLPSNELVTFSQMMHVALYPPKHIFNLRGESGNTLYLVMDGSVSMKSAEVITGLEIEHQLRVGEWFGLLSLVENMSSFESCSAPETVTLASFHRVQFNELFDTAPSAGRLLLYMLSKQLARALILQNKRLGILMKKYL